MTLTLKTIALNVILAISSVALADELLTKPAQLTDSGASLQNRIRFPRTTGDVSVTIPCITVVSERGLTSTKRCTNINEDYEPYVRAIERLRAVSNVKIEPAVFDGKRVRVLFLFSVHFTRVGEHEEITVFPNHGVNFESLGLNYSSPQPILEWWERLPPGRPGQICTEKTTALWIASTINNEGRVLNSTPVFEPEEEPCAQLYIERLKDIPHIPAFTEAGPVQAVLRRNYVHVFE